MATGGMLDAYLLAQALGWEWNFTTAMIMLFAPVLIIGGFYLILFILNCIDE